MTIPTGLAAKPQLPPPVFTDLSSLDALRGSVSGDGSGAIEPDESQLKEAAKQFSSIFLHMALKSMREASFGGGILDSQQSEFYRDMFDQQIALDLSQGEGFGLTQVIVDQLSYRPEMQAAAETSSQAASNIPPRAGAETYSRVAKENLLLADKESSGQISTALDRSQGAVDAGVNVTSRLALP